MFLDLMWLILEVWQYPLPFGVLVNKRLDEWVYEDRMDFTKLEQPHKEKTATPVKSMNGSRPSSPEREVVVGDGIVRLILGLHPANERRRYFVTTSFIGWVQAY